MKYPVYFAHANGFPAGVYHKMLSYLSTQCDLGFIDTVGHSKVFPVTDCWPYLVDETLHYITQHYDAPVFGVGHSLGGILLLYAAVRCPHLFQGLIILDSPLLRPSRSFAVWAAKKLQIIDRFTPGGNTLRRRDCWVDTMMVYDYYERKAAFARFDPDCLMDYAVYGTEPHSEGRRLKFRPVVEHSIYCTLPHNFPKYRHSLCVPTTFIAGSESDVLTASDFRWMQRHFPIMLDEQPGTHLFPFEHPVETAQRILSWIPRLLQQALAIAKL